MSARGQNALRGGAMQQVCGGGVAIAQQIAQVYQANSAVAAVMVSGSIARGVADLYSDLEIGVFWHKPPIEQERKQAIAALDSELWSFTPSTAGPPAIASEHYGLRSVKIGEHTYTARTYPLHLAVKVIQEH